MADPDQLEMCWNDLAQMGIVAATHRRPDRPGVVPVTYINSAAAIKAFCGEHGGVVCTSSNAAATLTWAWERGERMLFLPDQHLGPEHRLQDGRAARRDGGVGSRRDRRAASTPRRCGGRGIILWKGHCSVHTRFTVRQIEQLRAQHPGVRVIVHPEVPWEVVQAADESGSTEYIITTGEATARPDRSGRSAPRSTWSTASRARSRRTRTVAVARSVRLPVLDDVPRVAEPPAVGARRAGRRRGPQPDRRARRAEALDAGRARPHAVDLAVDAVRSVARESDPVA